MFDVQGGMAAVQKREKGKGKRGGVGPVSLQADHPFCDQTVIYSFIRLFEAVVVWKCRLFRCCGLMLVYLNVLYGRLRNYY